MIDGVITQVDTAFHENRESTHVTNSVDGAPLQASDETLTGYGPGWNLGGGGLSNVPAGFGAPAWSVDQFKRYDMTIATRGIKQIQSMVMNSQAIGDTAGIYAYINSDGGVLANSDEGVTAATLGSGETTGYFHGVVSSTTGVGDRAPKLQQYSSGSSQPLNTSQVSIANNVLSVTLAGGAATPPVGRTFLLNGPSGGDPLTFLNGLTLTVASASGETITAAYNYAGTLAATSYAGTVTPIQGSAWTTDGGILLNLSKAVYTGNVSGDESSFGIDPAHQTLTQIAATPTAGTSFPATTAWGLVTSTTGANAFAIVNPATSMDINTPVPTPLKVALQGKDSQGNYQKFVVGSLVTVAGSNFTEQAPVTAVADVQGDSSQQLVTIAVRYPNQIVYLFQGGLAGYYLSLDASTLR